MNSILKLKFKELIELIKARKVSCVELLGKVFDQIESYDHLLQCYISIQDKEELLKLARLSDERWDKKNPLSLIDGIPIAVKDNIHSLGLKTTCASNILKNYDPPFEATSVAKIKNRGGLIIGKTNLDEFAMGSTTENSSMKNTKNPWNINKVPGGSSGGSASAVSSRMAILALGSDTGGSIRQPASFCGVIGIKPTYGLVSRYGLVAYASSLDQIGTFSNDVYGSSVLLNIISGYDKNDSTSLNVDVIDYIAKQNIDVKGLKIAVFPEFLQEGINEDVKKEFKKTIDIFKQNGAIIENVKFNPLEYIIATYYFIATAEAASNLSRYDGVKYGFRSSKQENYEKMLFNTRSLGFGKEVKKRILLGNFVLSSGYYDEYYRKAQKIRTLIMNEIKNIFNKYDIILTPTTPDIAFDFNEGLKDPLKLYLADITTVLANLAGVPAISVPCGFVKNMPVGLQIIGKPLDELKLFNSASFIENSLSLDLTPPLDKIDKNTIDNLKKQETNYVVENEDHTVTYFSKQKIKEVSDLYKDKSKRQSNRILCSELNGCIGKQVTIKGWIHKINSLGGIEFYTLRDMSGMTQLVIEKNIDRAKLKLETVIEITGKATKEERSPYDNIEIKVEKVEILGHSDDNPPIKVFGNLDNVTLPTILDNRTISIRNPKILKVFKIQSEILKCFSEFLRKNNFTEIKTPKIISSGTEGGTNIFEVKYFDKTAYLAQSPQFYKQIMVGSGFERVFEVGPVFRAEMHDTIRHLNEYTSLDFEMGFINDEQDIIDMQENLIKYTINYLYENHKDILDEFEADVKLPDNIPRLHFLEALDIARHYGIKNMDGDISPEGERVLCDYAEKVHNSSFVYIIGYPVKKRPMYTMPDLRLPGYTRSFDLLFKGLEITTGGQRINDYKMLKQNIKEFGGNPKEFKHYLDIFKYGMPPHGGLGMGLERITMKLLNLKNVREASLFPRDRGRVTP
jgi:aspartyl-tRNA(Asn)/glutamyl-tRNA(Gln) amidotransferase subunit A